MESWVNKLQKLKSFSYIMFYCRIKKNPGKGAEYKEMTHLIFFNVKYTATSL